jgi:general secretion pathway protein D
LKSVALGLADKTSSAYSVTNIPIGPSIDIIPDVEADGYAIDLTVIANLTEFLGYDDVGPFPQAIPTEPLKPLPRFRVRKAMSTATVQDGQTLMLGGFVARDLRNPTNTVPVLGNIPLLGRFFRNEYASRTNKQLIVFVTPTIIDPAGNRVHPPDNDSPDEESAPAK